MILNIGSRSGDWRAEALSNFPRFPFVLDGIWMASVEGFVQGIKFPDGHPSRHAAFQSFGYPAKKIGKKSQRDFVYWTGIAMPYGSVEHHALVERAIRAKFEQNPEAMKALLATKGMEITHDLGYPESPRTSLPARIFCGILTRIREENLNK